MTRKQKAKSQIDDLSHKFLRNNNEFRIAKNIKADGSINARGIAWIDSNYEARAANSHTPGTYGVLASDVAASADDIDTYVVQGPALVYPQTRIEPGLPVKVSEAGRIVNGVQIQTGNRTILSAASGEDSQITDSDANDEGLTVVSDSASDTSQDIYVYYKEATTGTAKMAVANINGTTAVNMQDPTSGGTVSADEVLGLLKSASTVGTITLTNTTTSTTLITATAGQDDRGIISIASADQHKSFGRYVQITMSAASTDEFMIIGTDEAGDAQYEIITHAASMPVVLRSSERFNTVTYVAAGKIAAARTIALAGLPSNVFEPALRNEYGDITYTGNTQASGLIRVVSDDNSTDIGQKIMVLGCDSTTLRYDEFTLNGTTAVDSSSNYTEVYAAWVSEGTPVGSITIDQTAGAADLFEFDAATYNSGGALVPYKGNENTGIYLDADRASTITHEISGCNGRATLTCSNTSATDVLAIFGEDVDGSAQAELVTLVAGTADLENAYSRILVIGGVTLAATEYVKVSYEQEDDAGSCCGWAVNGSSTQSTSTAVEIMFKPSITKSYGTRAEAVIEHRIEGNAGGYTLLDTLAEDERLIVFPDLAGTVALTSGAITKPSTVVTIGSGCDYDDIDAYLTAGITAGDALWYLGTGETVTGSSLAISDAISIIGVGDDVTITGALAGDAIVDITGNNVELYEIQITNTNDGAGDIALLVNGDGTELHNCVLDGGASATGVALDADLGANEELYLYNCRITDGILDFDGNASSTVYINGGIYGDHFNIDTGMYYLNDVDINANVTTGAAAAASIWMNNCDVSGNVALTTSTIFEQRGGNISGTFTHTAGSSTQMNSVDIAGAVSVVAGTYLDFTNMRMGSTIALTGAVTEMYLRDCDVTSTFDMNTAAQTVYAHDCLITGNATINHASAVFEAHGCRFGANLVSTDSDSFKIYGGTVAGDLTLTAGTIHKISNVDVTGATSVVASSYADINNVVFTGAVALTGAVTESFWKGCDMASTFDMSTAAQMAELRDCNVTGIATINHANADFEAYDTIFGNNLVCTNATTFKVVGGSVAGATTITAGSLHEISNTTLTGNISLVASTYLKISDSIIAGTVTQSGAITEGFMYNCDLASTLDMGTAGAMLELHGCNVTGVATINHASADFEANDCVFGNNLVSTDSDAFRVKGGEVAGALTLTAGTIHEVADCTVTGACSLVASSYADFSNIRFGNNFTQSGAVTEGYLRDCDITGTFGMNTAGGTLNLFDCRVTGASTINHASAVLNAHDTEFLALVTITDSSTEEYRDCRFHSYTNNGTGTSVAHYNTRVINGDFTINNAAIVVDIIGGDFEQELVVTDADSITLKSINMPGNGSDSITLTDSQTAFYMDSCNVGDHFTIADSTLVELRNCTLEQFTDNGSDDINIYACTVTGAVVPDSADWDSYNSNYLSTVTESAATAVDFWGGRIVGTLTQAAGTVNVHGTSLNAVYAGTVGGIHSFDIPTDHYVVGGNQMFTTIDAAVASIAANDTYHLPDQSYTVASPSQVISQQTAWYGEGESTTITDAAAADAVIDVTAAGCQFYNISFENTENGAGADTALKMVNVGGEFHNCAFNGGTNAANLALDLDADGADLSYFYYCDFEDGKIDANGNASSIAEFHNCNIDDAVELDTGTYIFRDCDFASTITTATAGTSYFYNCEFNGTVTIAASTTAYFYNCKNDSTIDIAPTGIAYIYGGSPGTVNGPVVNQSYYKENAGSSTYYRRFDFFGDTIPDELNATADAGSTAPAISSPIQGGVVIGVTDGTGADQVRLATGTNGTWHTPLYHAGMEARVQVDSIAIIELLVGFYDDAGDYAYIEVDVTNLGDAEPHYVTNNAAAGESSTDCSNFVAISASTWYRIKVQMIDDGSVKFYIDDTLVGTSAADAVEKDGSTAMFMPIIYLAEQGAAAKTLTVDYLEYWGDRA